MSHFDRAKLVASATEAAKRQLETGTPQRNPWPEVSDAGVVWQATFERALCSDVLEGSAT